MTAEVETTAEPAAENAPPEADFLFHLYRGSELLSDHRLIEAQSELEYALTLEPSDARTHGLLAVVYFRRGFYTRAIGTYRDLLRERPDDPTHRLNLALCYLKTAQPQAARIELESLVMEDVDDLRAWGYLAVTLQRLGYAEQAEEAFARAGHAELGRRKIERAIPLDAGELSFELVDALAGRRDSLRPSMPVPAAPPPVAISPKLDTLGWGTHPRAAPPPRAWIEAPPLANFIEDARLERIGDGPGVTVLGSRLARIEIDQDLSPLGFAFRLESLRSYTGTVDRDLLARQTRVDAVPSDGNAGETFGGIGTPFATMKGPGQLVVGPRTSQRVVAFTLYDDVVFFREDAVVGFDLSLHYENGRVGVGSAARDGLPLVQLKGQGTVLLELAADLLALEVKSGGLTARKEIVVGWVGRLFPRSLTGEDAPGGQRGLIGFSGEGVVLVAAK
jgi:hypothetical protein